MNTKYHSTYIISAVSVIVMEDVKEQSDLIKVKQEKLAFEHEQREV